MTKNRTPTPVYLDPGMHSGLEVKGLKDFSFSDNLTPSIEYKLVFIMYNMQNNV